MCQVVEVVAGLEDLDLTRSDLDLLANLVRARVVYFAKRAEREGFVPGPGQTHKRLAAVERYTALEAKLRDAVAELAYAEAHPE